MVFKVVKCLHFTTSNKTGASSRYPCACPQTQQLPYCGAMSEPCCIIDPQLCQIQLFIVRLVSRYPPVASDLHGCGFVHSFGEILQLQSCHSLRTQTDRQTHRHAYFGRMSHPCPMREPIENHRQFMRLNVFSSSSGSGLQG